MATSNEPGTALITGASSGIGAIYADRLASRGYDVILVARDVDRLMTVGESIKRRHGRTARILPADLTLPEGLAGVERILKEDGAITTLVNNAGFGAAGPLLASDVERMTEMLAVNVTAVTRLTYAAVPGFVERERGTIINIASIVAIAPEVLNGVYGASKAYVLAFSQSLRKELFDKGIRVQAVLPGPIATEFWNVAGSPVTNLPESWVMNADELVDAALAGLDAEEFVTIPTLADDADWHSYEAARQAMIPKLPGARAAARYRKAISAA